MLPRVHCHFIVVDARKKIARLQNSRRVLLAGKALRFTKNECMRFFDSSVMNAISEHVKVRDGLAKNAQCVLTNLHARHVFDVA
jgi:hypothetical protein